MKSRGNLLVLVVVLALTVVVTVVFAAVQVQQPQLRTSYTIVSKRTQTYPDGHTIDVDTEKTYVAPTGEWFSVKVFANGRLEKSFGKPGDGVYMYNPRRRSVDWIRPYPSTFPDPKINLNNPHYVSTETVLGYSAYLLRTQSTDRSTDTYLAPRLNGDIIKQVITRNGVTTRLEPVLLTIEWDSTGDPGPAPQWSPPSWWSIP